ncbi:MAG: gamma-glutamyltransferase family protein [SAR324 cluster bacterium]|nr:gamma-glutamyltransferase family protein [SAR324 cluster bacterium]
MPEIPSHTDVDPARPTLRPTIRGTRGMVSSGQHLASLAGLRMLERGGNAVDAGVAAGICLAVVQSDLVNFGGVAPILVFQAETGRVHSIAGLGRWPGAATAAYFRERHGGQIPAGALCSVVPAAPDAWVRALQSFGTATFGEAAAEAIALAEEGFPMHEFMANNLRADAETLSQWPSSAEVFLPAGRPPEPGELFRQPALGRTLRRMAEAERNHGNAGREAALEAARREFYEGAIAAELLDFHRRHGGMLTPEDLAAYRSSIEPAPCVGFHGYDVHGCGAWCQGPTLLEALNLLEGFDLAALGHNSAAYVHTLTECFKLAFADREAFIGDPDFVDVPLEGLLSKAYAEARRGLVDPERAWTEMPPAGDPWVHEPARRPAAGAVPASSGETAGTPLSAAGGETHDGWDTSHVCAIDRWGNAFSATPSDAPFNTPIVPGLGIIVSGRGSQSWTEEEHPASIAPGKRPRLTPNPAIVTRNGKAVMAFGTPGGDVQIQVMAQVLLNVLLFGMDPQAAVEAPRFATYNYPSSFAPHATIKGLLRMEGRLPASVRERLAALGNTIEVWPDFSWRAGGICATLRDEKTGVLLGAADPRRECYAVGW